MTEQRTTLDNEVERVVANLPSKPGVPCEIRVRRTIAAPLPEHQPTGWRAPIAVNNVVLLHLIGEHCQLKVFLDLEQLKLATDDALKADIATIFGQFEALWRAELMREFS